MIASIMRNARLFADRERKFGLPPLCVFCGTKIPYFAWANLGMPHMSVWLPLAGGAGGP